MGCADILLLDVGVDHRGIQGGMAEQLLNVLHRRAVGQRSSGERMAEDVRGDRNGYMLCAVPDGPYFALQRLTGDVPIRSAGPAKQGR